MKTLLSATLAAALFIGGAGTATLFAQGKGGGGRKGQQTGPKDGSGKQQGKGQKGKRTGPKDGTGPIHTPPQK